MALGVVWFERGANVLRIGVCDISIITWLLTFSSEKGTERHKWRAGKDRSVLASQVRALCLCLGCVLRIPQEAILFSWAQMGLHWKSEKGSYYHQHIPTFFQTVSLFFILTNDPRAAAIPLGSPGIPRPFLYQLLFLFESFPSMSDEFCFQKVSTIPGIL